MCCLRRMLGKWTGSGSCKRPRGAVWRILTCYSRRAAVGGRRWWWERSCARGHQPGGRGRTRSAACLWSGSDSGSPLSLRCSPVQSNCSRKEMCPGQGDRGTGRLADITVRSRAGIIRISHKHQNYRKAVVSVRWKEAWWGKNITSIYFSKRHNVGIK